MPAETLSPLILSPGRNCWRIEHTRRFKLLIDGDAYFTAVRAAIRQARHSIFILGWDIDSRTRLAPAGADDGYPEPLGDFLHAMAEAHEGLNIHVLNWDFAMLYALEREWLPVYKLGWHKQRRLAFRMDARHPVGASHHQKVVVIDDTLAFVGGMDLTRCRWDTPDHACDNPLRRDPDGVAYAPFHDVHAMLDGDAARALGELARQRWERSGAVPAACAPAVDEDAGDPWPPDCAPDLSDFNIAIARTEPAFAGAAGIYEIRQLYLDAIASARRHLFFENQYFTSNVLCNALAARLADDDAPDVAVISPRTQSGWLEQATMGNLRARVHQRLKSADRGGRYRLYCPQIPGLKEACLNVHSKVFAMDDSLFCVGSANMSNRSMNFDTECNLVIEAQGGPAQQTRIRQAVADMRNRLLGEHLATTPQAVADAIERQRGLHAAISALQRDGRTLAALDPVVLPELEALTSDNAVFDPERPIDADQLVEQFVPSHARRPIPRRLIGLGMLAILLVMLALAWRFTPLREWVNLTSLIAFARNLKELPFAPLIVIGGFVAAGMLMIPVTLLIAVSGIVYGAVYGALYAMIGAMLSAALGFGLGAWLGREALHQVLGHRINALSKRLAQRGIMAMVVVRLLPVAPFTIVNMVAGASHIGLRDYLIGTFFGLLPGILLTATFSHNLAEAVRHPDLKTIAVLVLLTALLIGVALGLQRLFKPRKDADAQ
ncbi:MAG: rane protein [Herbaspirillum sp.]|jgi:phospholipase D1/2|nr:rane protein [Herbaspirillum sp.]